MREKITAIFCAVLVFLVWASMASASPFHHHEKKDSALESNMAKHACPLDHHKKGLPCPHSQSKKDGAKYQIAPDCGGTPLASIPTSVDFSKNLFSVSGSSLKRADDKADGFILKAPRHKFSLSFQLDHPPQSL
jgi:hypothetical protein